MSDFVDALVARVLALEVNLLASRERMAAYTDREALHDVRIAVRKLRSLLRPFRKLIEAGRRDQRIARHPTWADLRESCAFSADPVGELVLHVFAVATPE
ncbi:MAG: squalene/phytoene synthase family protein, partial [Pseudomonas sp.]